jgi:hypothetical protein
MAVPSHPVMMAANQIRVLRISGSSVSSTTSPHCRQRKMARTGMAEAPTKVVKNQPHPVYLHSAETM